MKEGIHPKFEECTITCHCGNVMKTRSTVGDIKVEICSKSVSYTHLRAHET